MKHGFANHEKFWLNEAGQQRRDSELVKRSRGWTGQMWEEYLTSIEVGLRESLVAPKKFDALAERMINSTFESAQGHGKLIDFARIHVALSVLTPRQREVIELIYFKSLKQREVARLLGISEHRVRAITKISLEHAKRFFHRGGSHLPIGRGQPEEIDD